MTRVSGPARQSAISPAKSPASRFYLLERDITNRLYSAERVMSDYVNRSAHASSAANTDSMLRRGARGSLDYRVCDLN